MDVRRRRVFLAWMGFVLAILGLLVLVVSFFLLPLDVVPCSDACAQPQLSATAWEYSLTSLRDLPASLVFNVCLLVLCYLPLLAAVMVVACLLGFLIRPHRAFVTWSRRAWLTGSIALVLFLLVVLLLVFLLGALFLGGGPEVGFFGLLFGYGLLWAGNHVAFTHTVRETPMA
jgi:hypothetical protein